MSGPQRRSCGGGGWCHHISPDFLIDWIKAQFVEFVLLMFSRCNRLDHASWYWMVLFDII